MLNSAILLWNEIFPRIPRDFQITTGRISEFLLACFFFRDEKIETVRTYLLEENKTSENCGAFWN